MGAPPVGSSGFQPATPTPQSFDIDALFSKDPAQIRNACETYYLTQGNNLATYGNLLFDIANKEERTFDEKAVVLEALSESWIYPIAMSQHLRTDPFKFLYVFYNIKNEGARRKAINQAYSTYQHSSIQKFAQCFTEVHKQEWSIHNKQLYIAHLLDSFTPEQRQQFIEAHVSAFAANISGLAKDMLLIFQHADVYATAIHQKFPSVQKIFIESTASHLQFPYPCIPSVCQQLIWKLRGNDIRTMFPDLPPSQQALVAGSTRVDFFRILLQALPGGSQQSQEKPKKVVLFEHLACFPGGAAHFLSALPATQFADFIRDITKYESPAACTILPSLPEQPSQTFFLNLDPTTRTDFIRFVFPKDPEGRRNYISILSKNLPLANYLTSISTIAVPREGGEPANIPITSIIENVVQAANNEDSRDFLVGYKDDLHAIPSLVIAMAFLNGELRGKLYKIIEHLSEEQIQTIATVVPKQLSEEFIKKTDNLFGNYYQCLPQEAMQTYSRSLSIVILSLKKKIKECYKEYQGHLRALKKYSQENNSPVKPEIYNPVATGHTALLTLQREVSDKISRMRRVLSQLPPSTEKDAQTSVLNDCATVLKNQIQQCEDLAGDNYFNPRSYEVERSKSPEPEDEIIYKITAENLPHLGLKNYADFPAYGLTTNAGLAHLGITPKANDSLDSLVGKLKSHMTPTSEDLAEHSGEDDKLRAKVTLQKKFEKLFSAAIPFASAHMRDLLKELESRLPPQTDANISQELRKLISPQIILMFRAHSAQLQNIYDQDVARINKQYREDSDAFTAAQLQSQEFIADHDGTDLMFRFTESDPENNALQQQQARLEADHAERLKKCDEEHKLRVEGFQEITRLFYKEENLTTLEMIKLAKALHYLTALDFYFHQENLADNWKELNGKGITNLEELTKEYTINPGELFTLNAVIDRIKKKDRMTP